MEFIAPPVLRRGQYAPMYPLNGPSPAPSGQPAPGVVAAPTAQGLSEEHRAPRRDDPDRPEVGQVGGADGGGGPDGEHDDRDDGPVAPGRLPRGPTAPSARSEERRVGKECRSRW